MRNIGFSSLFHIHIPYISFSLTKKKCSRKLLGINPIWTIFAFDLHTHTNTCTHLGIIFSIGFSLLLLNHLGSFFFFFFFFFVCVLLSMDGWQQHFRIESHLFEPGTGGKTAVPSSFHLSDKCIVRIFKKPKPKSIESNCVCVQQCIQQVLHC